MEHCSKRSNFAQIALVCAALVLPSFGVLAHDILEANSGTNEAIIAFESVLASEPTDSPTRPVLHSFVARKLTWSGPTVSVCFWNGDPVLQDQILAIAGEWTEDRPISFVGKTGGIINRCSESTYKAFDIRVSVMPRPDLVAANDNPYGFWSVVGRASRKDTRRVTLNIPFRAQDDTNDIRRFTLHEFGHALGFLHEHQREVCSEEFNLEAIKTDLNWNDAQIRTNILSIPDSDPYYGPTAIGSFDLASVMLYSMYRRWFKQEIAHPKCYRAEDVSYLSSGDLKGMEQAYPTSPSGNNEMVPLTFEELTTRAEMLEAQSVQLRETASSLSTDVQDSILAHLGDSANAEVASAVGTAMSAQASEMLVTADALAAEAKQYHFRPQTVQLLKRALELYEPTE